MRLVGVFLVLTMSLVMTSGLRIRTLTRSQAHHGHDLRQADRTMMKQGFHSQVAGVHPDDYRHHHPPPPRYRHPYRDAYRGGYGNVGVGGGGGGGADAGAYAGVVPGAIPGAYPGAGPLPVPGQTTTYTSNNAQGNHMWDPTWTVSTPGNIVVTFTAAALHDIIFSFTSDPDPINPQTQNAWQVTLVGLVDTTPGQSTICRGIQGKTGIFVSGQPCTQAGQRYWATLSATANLLTVGVGDVGQNMITSQQLDPSFGATMATRVGFSSWNTPVTYTNIIVTSA